MRRDEIGPYCSDDECAIPYGIKVGVDIPAAAYFDIDPKTHRVQAIDVFTDSLFWNDLVPIIKRKYGPNWSVERAPMPLMSEKGGKPIWVTREIMTLKSLAENTKTKDTCAIWAENYDMVFHHDDALGADHALVEIKLISANF